jgi:hypothetical protein
MRPRHVATSSLAILRLHTGWFAALLVSRRASAFHRILLVDFHWILLAGLCIHLRMRVTVRLSVLQPFAGGPGGFARTECRRDAVGA